MFLLVVVLPVHVSCMFILVVVLSVHVSFGRYIGKETWTGNTTTKTNMDRQYNDQKKHGQTIQRPTETWTDNTTTKRNMDRQYNDQRKHGQTIQRPKETWTDNTTTKGNMDRQYNDQKKHGQACPCFFWSLYCLSKFLLVVVLSVHVSFCRCIACPCFFWSLYCLSMFLLVAVLPVHVSFGRKHGTTIQRPKETWTGYTKTNRNMDRQYNDQKKHGQTIQRPKETCLSMFLLAFVSPVHVSFGRCIPCPFFF
jgi:phenolic acid decarboxylase